MKIAIGGIKNRWKKWDNAVRITDFDIPDGEWPAVRHVISSCGGRVSSLNPLTIGILDCDRQSGDAREVKRLIIALAALQKKWKEKGC